MEIYNISTEKLIAVIERDRHAKDLFKPFNLDKFDQDKRNGKSMGFAFEDAVDYKFTYKSLNKLLIQYIETKLSKVQFIFILEAITMLEDTWTFEDDTLFDTMQVLSYFDNQKR